MRQKIGMLSMLLILTSTAMGQPPAAPASPAPAEPSPQDTIRDLERRATPPAPATPPPAPAPAPAPATGPAPVPVVAPTGLPIATTTAGGAKLLREGTFLASRRGRLIRTSDGNWTFAFDADRSGKADPSMTLMPCLNLQAMERLVERGGESLSFTVSGQVFVYRGRNYLLPTLYVVNRRADMSSGG